MVFKGLNRYVLKDVKRHEQKQTTILLRSMVNFVDETPYTVYVSRSFNVIESHGTMKLNLVNFP